MLTLTDVRLLAADVARDEDPTLQVVAALSGEGGTEYVEVILTLDCGPSEACRLTIGISRNAAESQVRQQLRERLRDHLRSHRPNDPALR